MDKRAKYEECVRRVNPQATFIPMVATIFGAIHKDVKKLAHQFGTFGHHHSGGLWEAGETEAAIVHDFSMAVHRGNARIVDEVARSLMETTQQMVERRRRDRLYRNRPQSSQESIHDD